MNILDNIYLKAIAENENNLRFWDDYLQKLKALDFGFFSEKLKVPTLVPVGSRILFRGEIKHTNEVTAALGADYFTKCSTKQADILRQHRIKGAQLKVEELQKEKSYLESQLSFNKQNLFEAKGHEIVEEYSEEEDKLWREKHKENMRMYKQNAKGKDECEREETDEELWNKLEELELKEELENELELMSMKENVTTQSYDEVIFKKDPSILDEVKATEEHFNKKVKFQDITEDDNKKSNIKFDLIQKVLDKQIELEEKLYLLKNKERKQSKTEKDLIAKLDEMEQLEEVEDEMEMLEDILENDEIIEEYEIKQSPMKLKRSVSFADETESSETLELTFKHSDVHPDKEPYNSNRGILKPSDIYEAHKQNFSETTSILKKSNYDKSDIRSKESKTLNIQTDADQPKDRRSIVVKDITETISSKDNLSESTERPASLFKMKRQQRKNSFL